MSAREFWDRETVETVHTTNWMTFPRVRAYIMEQIGGTGWAMDWLLAQLGGRRLARALSIGCGTGALERDLVTRDVCDRIDAFDGSPASLAIARAEAKRAGQGDRIRYFAADFNRPALPRGVYDAVFFHQSLHHVAKLEKLLRAVLPALKDDGLVYLDEYVGPSRHWWNDARFAAHRELFDRLVPREARWLERLPLPFVDEDPSEAVQSGQILDQLRLGFDIVAQRSYGGNVVSIFCQAVRWDRAPEGLIERFIDAERAWLARPGVQPYYTLLLARPKRSRVARAIASGRWFAEPKLKRIGREMRKLLP